MHARTCCVVLQVRLVSWLVGWLVEFSPVGFGFLLTALAHLSPGLLLSG